MKVAVALIESLIGKAALPILWEFLKLYPSPEAVQDAEWQPIAKMITPLGLHEKRAQIMIRFSSKPAAFHCVPVVASCPIHWIASPLFFQRNTSVRTGSILLSCMVLENMAMIPTGYSVLLNGRKWDYRYSLTTYTSCSLHCFSFALSTIKIF